MIFSKLIKRWVLVAIAVPLAAAGVRRIGQAVESRRGQTRTTRLLNRSADLIQRVGGRPTRRAARRGW